MASTRPALMVKVDNVGGAVPQAGLNSADLVVEEPVEGGLTRFVAIFHSTDPEVVGPVRSARPIDADISRIIGGGGVLLFSGASPQEIKPVKADSEAVLISDDWATAPGTFSRDPERSGEHNLFADSTKAWEWAAANATTHAPREPFPHTAAPSATARPANEVSFRFPDNSVRWEWDGKHWLRSQHGKPHETVDDGQVRADSVVIISVTTTTDPDLKDVLGNPTPVVDLRSSGPAWVLREGTVTKGTWSRSGLDAPLVLTDSAGQPMGAKPGRSWLEILPDSDTPEVS